MASEKPVLRDDIQTVSIEQISENDWNPNEVPEHTMESLKAGIAEEGFLTPILVQKKTGRIIDGAHRYQAAKELGMETVLVQYLDVSDIEAKKLTIAMNKRARGGHFLAEKLDPLLAELAESGDDDLQSLSLKLGYPEEELNRFLESSSSWLDNLASGSDDDDDIPTEGDLSTNNLPAGKDYSKLQYIVNDDQKRTIIQAINAAKEELDVTHSGEALLHICQEYLGE